MRFVRYEYDGSEELGVLDGDVVREIGTSGSPGLVTAALFEDARETGTERALDDVRLRPPVTPGKIICLGLNYLDHAEEAGYDDLPDEPMLFAKATSALVGPGDPIVYPNDVEQLDYEAELAVVIGRETRRVAEADVWDRIAGYTAFNDVSARDVQYRFSQVHRGKSYDTFGPLGPALVTPDEVDPDDLAIRSWLNDELRQDSSTADMIFDVAATVSSVSQAMTLYPGDVIATGTPHGVGIHRDVPKLMSVGDTITVEIEGIGELSNPVVAESDT